MTVLNYMKSVRNAIISRHEGETFFSNGADDTTLVQTRSAYEILAEIDALQGLNTRERLAARKVKAFA